MPRGVVASPQAEAELHTRRAIHNNPFGGYRGGSPGKLPEEAKQVAYKTVGYQRLCHYM